MDSIPSDEVVVSKGGELLDTSDREELAHFYLKKHKILELLHNITAELVYETPEDPQNFIIEYVEKLKTSEMTNSGYPCLFDESNIRSLFGIMDPAGNGFITHEQYKSGMENLGIVKYERNPPGTEEEKITFETFLTIANNGLSRMSAAFTK